MMMILCLSVYLKLNKVTIIYTVFTSRRALHFVCVCVSFYFCLVVVIVLHTKIFWYYFLCYFCAELNEFYVEYVSGLGVLSSQIYLREIFVTKLYFIPIYSNIFIYLVLVFIAYRQSPWRMFVMTRFVCIRSDNRMKTKKFLARSQGDFHLWTCI